MTDPIEEKFLGCMYGLAIGDALGYPVEFMSLKEIKEIFGQEGVTDFDSFRNPAVGQLAHPIGYYSDDTQMSLATARGLLKSRTEDIDEIMKHICQEYITWAESPENNRAPGNACMSGLMNLKRGINWRLSGIPNAKGCGAAMRTAPIGLLFHGNLQKLIEVASAASVCTHANPTAIGAGIGTAYSVALAIRDCPTEEMLEKIITFSRTLDEDLGNKITEVREVLSYKDHQEALKRLGEGWVGDQALALGIYCFMKNPRDYRKTVLMAVNTNGDSDSIACIAGAISGAYNGVNSIPKKWMEIVENRRLLEQTAREIYLRAR